MENKNNGFWMYHTEKTHFFFFFLFEFHCSFLILFRPTMSEDAQDVDFELTNIPNYDKWHNVISASKRYSNAANVWGDVSMKQHHPDLCDAVCKFAAFVALTVSPDSPWQQQQYFLDMFHVHELSDTKVGNSSLIDNEDVVALSLMWKRKQPWYIRLEKHDIIFSIDSTNFLCKEDLTLHLIVLLIEQQLASKVYFLPALPAVLYRCVDKDNNHRSQNNSEDKTRLVLFQWYQDCLMQRYGISLYPDISDFAESKKCATLCSFELSLVMLPTSSALFFPYHHAFCSKPLGRRKQMGAQWFDINVFTPRGHHLFETHALHPIAGIQLLHTLQDIKDADLFSHIHCFIQESCNNTVKLMIRVRVKTEFQNCQFLWNHVPDIYVDQNIVNWYQSPKPTLNDNVNVDLEIFATNLKLRTIFRTIKQILQLGFARVLGINEVSMPHFIDTHHGLIRSTSYYDQIWLQDVNPNRYNLLSDMEMIFIQTDVALHQNQNLVVVSLPPSSGRRSLVLQVAGDVAENEAATVVVVERSFLKSYESLITTEARKQIGLSLELNVLIAHNKEEVVNAIKQIILAQSTSHATFKLTCLPVGDSYNIPVNLRYVLVVPYSRSDCCELEAMQAVMMENKSSIFQRVVYDDISSMVATHVQNMIEIPKFGPLQSVFFDSWHSKCKNTQIRIKKVDQVVQSMLAKHLGNMSIHRRIQNLFVDYTTCLSDKCTPPHVSIFVPKKRKRESNMLETEAYQKVILSKVSDIFNLAKRTNNEYVVNMISPLLTQLSETVQCSKKNNTNNTNNTNNNTDQKQLLPLVFCSEQEEDNNDTDQKHLLPLGFCLKKQKKDVCENKVLQLFQKLNLLHYQHEDNNNNNKKEEEQECYTHLDSIQSKFMNSLASMHNARQSRVLLGMENGYIEPSITSSLLSVISKTVDCSDPMIVDHLASQIYWTSYPTHEADIHALHQTHLEKPQECCVCYNSLVLPVRATSCCHIICLWCAIQVIIAGEGNSKKCPLCRTPYALSISSYHKPGILVQLIPMFSKMTNPEMYLYRKQHNYTATWSAQSYKNWESAQLSPSELISSQDFQEVDFSEFQFFEDKTFQLLLDSATKRTSTAATLSAEHEAYHRQHTRIILDELRRNVEEEEERKEDEQDIEDSDNDNDGGRVLYSFDDDDNDDSEDNDNSEDNDTDDSKADNHVNSSDSENVVHEHFQNCPHHLRSPCERKNLSPFVKWTINHTSKCDIGIRVQDQQQRQQHVKPCLDSVKYKFELLQEQEEILIDSTAKEWIYFWSCAKTYKLLNHPSANLETTLTLTNGADIIQHAQKTHGVECIRNVSSYQDAMSIDFRKFKTLLLGHFAEVDMAFVRRVLERGQQLNLKIEYVLTAGGIDEFLLNAVLSGYQCMPNEPMLNDLACIVPFFCLRTRTQTRMYRLFHLARTLYRWLTVESIIWSSTSPPRPNINVSSKFSQSFSSDISNNHTLNLKLEFGIKQMLQFVREDGTLFVQPSRFMRWEILPSEWKMKFNDGHAATTFISPLVGSQKPIDIPEFEQLPTVLAKYSRWPLDKLWEEYHSSIYDESCDIQLFV